MLWLVVPALLLALAGTVYYPMWVITLVFPPAHKYNNDLFRGTFDTGKGSPVKYDSTIEMISWIILLAVFVALVGLLIRLLLIRAKQRNSDSLADETIPPGGPRGSDRVSSIGFEVIIAVVLLFFVWGLLIQPLPAPASKSRSSGSGYSLPPPTQSPTGPASQAEVYRQLQVEYDRENAVLQQARMSGFSVVNCPRCGGRVTWTGTTSTGWV